MDTLLIWLLIYFILASQFYLLDKKGKFFLRKLYLLIYNLGHREAITEDQVTKGFVYNQTLGTRLTAAVVFDIILSLLFWRFNTLGTGIKIILLFLGTPTVFLGFWFGGLMMAFFSRVFSKTVTTLDDIGTGKIALLDTIRHSFDESKEQEKGMEETEDKPEVGRTDNSKEQRAKEDQEALDALRKFQRGGK